MQGIKVSKLKKRNNKYEYRGRLWVLNKPVPSTSKTKKMMVLATKIIKGEKHDVTDRRSTVYL